MISDEECAEAYEEALEIEYNAIIDRIVDLIYKGEMALRAERLATAGYVQSHHPDPKEAVKGLAATTAALSTIKKLKDA
jgi:hypothetical protein